MPGIGIILNRNAGKHRAFRGEVGQKLTFVLGDPHSVRETGAVEEIADVARTFRDRDIEILGISGGDGSNHYTLSTFIQEYGARPLPRVAFLCGGTHNAHAASIGVRGTPEKLIENIVRKYHTGERFDVTHRVLLRIDDGHGVRHGFSMATGFMCRFYQELILKQSDSPAKVAGLIGSWFGSWIIGGKRIRKIFALEPGRAIVDGEPVPWSEINGVSCSGMEKLGLGFTPYPRASETPTTFHVGVLRVRPRTFAALMLAYKRGRVPNHPEQRNTIASRVQVEMEAPIAYVLDGEIYRGGTRLEVSTGPRIELIVR